jgi:hypothetical protein
VKKVLTWLATIFGAIALALLGIKAQGKKDRANRNEQKAAELLQSNVKTEIAKGEKLAAKAEIDKAKAAEAEARMEARLNEIAKNESLAAVADRFNRRKLRDEPGDPAT